jgi:hypothetical protein
MYRVDIASRERTAWRETREQSICAQSIVRDAHNTPCTVPAKISDFTAVSACSRERSARGHARRYVVARVGRSRGARAVDAAASCCVETVEDARV